MSLYASYVSFVKKALRNASLLLEFKSNPEYTPMLEHTSFEQGVQYLEKIRQETTFTSEDILAYCSKNDMIGGGRKFDYGFIVTSPSNFRYILHSHLALTHMKDTGMTEGVDVVEIGCGYGGLCLAIAHFAEKYAVHISAYNLIDLNPICELQTWYLSKFSLPYPCTFHDAATFGSDVSSSRVFAISAYCFSEIDDECQHKYVSALFPKVKHGIFVWNNIPVYDFGFPLLKNVPEIPLTGPLNRYVYF